MDANTGTEAAQEVSAGALGDVLITESLHARPSRPPDYEAQARALEALARELSTNPRGLLQKVVEAAMALCRADSAGVSILEPGGEHGIFRWHAVAGAFAANINGTMPREASPCGEVMSRNQVLLFDRGERYFPALRGIDPPIYENLLAPWEIDGAPAGTLWVISHTPDRQFDSEDARLVSSLAQFASAAWQAVTTLDLTDNVRSRRAAEQEIRELNVGLERRVAERTAELAQAYDSVRTSEARYRTLFESIDEGFCVIEVLFDQRQRPVDYRFLEANPAFVEQTGLDNAIGRTMRELAAAHEPHWFDIYGKVALTGESIRFEAPAEALGRWYDVYAFRIGEPRERKVAILFNDIAERKRMEAALRDTQKLESLGVLAAGIAHDFNNLLTVIMGNISLGLHALQSDATPRLSSRLTDALRASERASDLTRQLLAYAGKGTFVVGPLDFCALVRETAGLFRASVPKQVEVKYELPDHCPVVEADAAQLQQVVMNLVLNAAEAVGDKPGTVTLRAGVTDLGDEDLHRGYLEWNMVPGRYLRFEVEDTGVGMDEATRCRIFDPFFTTKFLGRGLGLSAVHGIIRGHRGGMAVQSAPESGTTFTVLLPLAETAATHGVDHSAQARLDEPVPDRGTIALVDDEEGILQVARSALELAGYRVLTAPNGAGAVELARREDGALSLMLLDLAMPVMGGIEAIPLIRQARPDLPIVVMTGLGDRTTLQQVNALGIEVIEKPFRAEQLAVRVGTLLQGRA